MSAPANRWKLGLFVLGAMGAGVAGLTWLGMNKLRRATHEAWMYFDEALNGLEPGSPVKFRGQSLGVVDTIRLAQDEKHLEVRILLYDDRMVDFGLDPFALDERRPFPPQLRAQVVASFITGTAFLQVDFFEAAPPPEAHDFAVREPTIPTVRSTIKSFEEGTRELLRILPELTESGRALLDQARADLTAAKIPELRARIDLLLDGWSVDREPLQPLVAEAGNLAKDLRAAIAKAEIGATSDALREASDKSAAAADQLALLGRDLRGEVQHLRAALQALTRFLALIERDPGALLHGRGTAPSPLREATK